MKIELSAQQIYALRHGRHSVDFTPKQIAMVTGNYAVPQLTPHPVEQHVPHPVQAHRPLVTASQHEAHAYTHAHSHAPTAGPASPHSHGSVPTFGSHTTWAEFFRGEQLSFRRNHMYQIQPYSLGVFIPPEGVAIQFEIKKGDKGTMGFQSVETTAISTIREGVLNQSPLDFSHGTKASWGTGVTLGAAVNMRMNGVHTTLHPGIYYLNLRNRSPREGRNYIKLRCYISHR